MEPASEAAPRNDPPRSPADIERDVRAILKTVYDPEIPVDIYELGLIYAVNVAEDGAVEVRMTLTAPACPAAGMLPQEVEDKVRSVEGVTSSKVELVWEPPWGPDKMTEAAKLTLGML